MDIVRFIRGPQCHMDKIPLRDGQLFIVDDTGKLYLDLPRVGRVEICTGPYDIKENDYGKDTIHEVENQDLYSAQTCVNPRYGHDFGDFDLSPAGLESIFNRFCGGEQHRPDYGMFEPFETGHMVLDSSC